MQRNHRDKAHRLLRRLTTLGLACVAAMACTTQPILERPVTPAGPSTRPPRPEPSPTAGTQTVEIATRQVTAADVSASPDGKWLIFSALGHLFRLPSKGGDAEQLTFGPYFDGAPAISPEGNRVVFVSNRSPDSIASLYLLNLSTGQLEKLTTDAHAESPAWAPDGKSIAYLSAQPGAAADAAPYPPMSRLRRLELTTERVTTLTPPRFISALDYVPDGRLIWAEITPADPARGSTTSASPSSQILALEAARKTSPQLFVEGVVTRLATDRSRNLVYFAKQAILPSARGVPAPETLYEVELPGGEPRSVSELEVDPAHPQLSAVSGQLWLSERGAFWKIDAKSGQREPLRLSLEAKLEVFPKSEPPPYVGEPVPKRASILHPRLVADGGVLFTAAGVLWRQKRGDSRPTRLFSTSGFEWGPAAPSPDGKRVAYQYTEGNSQELRVTDLDGKHSVTVAKTERSGFFEPAWEPSGKQLAYSGYDNGLAQVYVVNLLTGQRRKLEANLPHPKPHFSKDGQWLYFTARSKPSENARWRPGRQLQRVSMARNEPPEALTAFEHDFDHALVAPGSQWLYFDRHGEIWRVPLGSEPATEAQAERFSGLGGDSFSFAPDGRSLVYAAKRQVWQQSLEDDQKRALASLPLQVNTPEPLLIQHARPLALGHSRFLEPTSIYIEGGRIAWIGSENAHELRPGVHTLDAAGGYVIPGLIDLHGALRSVGTPPRDVDPVEAYVAFGVTTVANLEPAAPTLVSAWNDRRESLGGPVPRLLALGARIETAEFLSAEPSHPVDANEAELRQAVREAKSRSVRGIRLSAPLPAPLEQLVAEEARQQRLLVSAEGMLPKQVVLGAIRGSWSLEGMPAADLWKDDVLQLLAKTGVRITPLLSASVGNAVLFASEPGLRDSALFQRFSAPEDTRTGTPGPGPERQRLAFQSMLQGVKRAYAAGVSLLPGSDPGAPTCLVGHCLHTELWHLVEAGVPAIEVLRLATEGNAEALGASDHLGSIEAGKLADLVLLERDPLKDIRNSLAISHVVAGGRVFEQGVAHRWSASAHPAKRPVAASGTN